MRVDKGQFADKRVRQALGHTLDREAMVQALFKGKADIGNDNVIAPVYPYADPSVPQRPKDIAKAKELLQAAGVSNITATLHAVKLQEIPDMAVLVKGGAQEAGITLNVSVEDGSTFYGQAWCPAKPADPPCSGADEIGIVDYGHRGTPDVYLNASLKTAGVWNSSQYQSQEFDEAFPVLPGGGGRRRAEGGGQAAAGDPARGLADPGAVLLQLPARALEEVPGRRDDRARPALRREGLPGLDGDVRCGGGRGRSRPPAPRHRAPAPAA
jgi:hypothetical protein